MAALDNASFETPGGGLGLAASWTQAQDTAAENVGTFDQLGIVTPYESYAQGWAQNEAAKSEFETDDLSTGTFSGGAAFEGYEYEWALPATLVPATPLWNHQSLSYLSSADVSVGSFTGGDLYEDYEAAWDSNETALTLDTMVVSAGTFTGAKVQEDYEDGWSSNEIAESLTTWAAASVATFVGVPDDWEDYEPNDGATWSALS